MSSLFDNTKIAVQRRTWAEIDHGALRHNVAAIRTAIGPEPEILAVVKANAYGHGCEQVARTLATLVSCFGVASVEEAGALRGLGCDILILSTCLPWEREQAVAGGDIVSVSSLAEAEEFSKIGRCRVNVKIDTGMGRGGCLPERAATTVAAIGELPGMEIHSVSSHLPVSDEDAEFTSRQLELLSALRTEISRIVPGAKWHVLNSAGIFGFPHHAMEIVRAGLAIYGCAYPAAYQPLLRPILTWKSRIALVKDLPAGWGVSYGRTHVTSSPRKVAIVPVGYADGFPRQSSNQGAHVLCGGIRRHVLGRITMDQIVIEADDSMKEGQEVVIIGSQGSETITVRELAEKSQTIAWHIFKGLGERVKRVHR